MIKVRFRGTWRMAVTEPDGLSPQATNSQATNRIVSFAISAPIEWNFTEMRNAMRDLKGLIIAGQDDAPGFAPPFSGS